MPFVWVFVSFSGCADDETFLRCWNFVLHTYGPEKKREEKWPINNYIRYFSPSDVYDQCDSTSVLGRIWTTHQLTTYNRKGIGIGQRRGKRKTHRIVRQLNGFEWFFETKRRKNTTNEMARWKNETNNNKNTDWTHTYGGEKRNTVHNKRITNMCHEIWIMNFIDDRKPTFAFQEINGA